MTTITKRLLSGSTDGKPISITATSTAGNTIHTAVAGTTDIDEVWLWLSNTSASNVLATIEYGDATATNNIKYNVIAQDGLKIILPGLTLQNGATVKVFAATTAVLNAVGFVNRISP